MDDSQIEWKTTESPLSLFDLLLSTEYNSFFQERL